MIMQVCNGFMILRKSKFHPFDSKNDILTIQIMGQLGGLDNLAGQGSGQTGAAGPRVG